MIDMKRYIFACATLAALGMASLFPTMRSEARPRGDTGVAEATAGTLVSLDDQGAPQGLCPLKHTDVEATISGFLARVTVTQEFENPFEDRIEAVYTFPLPQNAAVDDMTMLIGDRTVKGKIKRREEARKIYEDARNRGQAAALLDQERPNIFTQAVANIQPGETVKIVISYVEHLKYDEGAYEFVFPMVVGPRYIPGNATGKQGGGWAPDTDQVPDASRITPPVTPKGTRAGHDISVKVSVNAGVPIDGFVSKTHEITLDRPAKSRAVATLKKQAVLPNKDFILRYKVAGAKIEDAILTHQAEKSGFFSMILQPPERFTVEDVTPKELVFVVDTSGSMSGFPMDKAKETMKLAIDGLYPRDTFNLITFAGQTKVLFPKPVPATPANIRAAQEFLASRRGGGGTEMMTAIRTALDPSDSQEHVRIVSFMTDGYVGNDMAIIDEIQKHPNARIFSFGIGSSVNRFLLEKMARFGRGEAEFVGLQDDGSAAARRFHERIRNPLLTDIAVDFGGLPVADVYPKQIPDLFSAKPVVLTGRYTGEGRGSIRLTGKMSGRAFERTVPVSFSRSATEHDVLATMWARTRIADLTSQDYAGVQNGNPRAEIKEQITQLGLDYRLMTQFTSFVAVEERVVTEGGRPRRVDVPVEMPHGVSYEGVFGEKKKMAANRRLAGASMANKSYSIAGGVIAQDAAAPVAPRPYRQGRERIEEAQADVRVRPNQPVSQSIPEGEPAIRAKIHPDLAARVAAGGSGKVEIEVWLADATPETLAALKKLGFETVGTPKVAKIVGGRIKISKVEALARLAGVRYLKLLTL
jgi:Ca-activated chloride channel family protein